MVRNTYALLIAGDEERFVEQVIGWRDYLLNVANFDQGKIWTHFSSENIDVLGGIRQFYQTVPSQDPEQNVVMMYFGHGLPGVFGPLQGKDPISYRDLVELIKHAGKTLFINDSCYSGSAIPIFNEVGLLPEKASIIASSTGEEIACGPHFQYLLLRALQEKKPFFEKEIKCCRNLYLSGDKITAFTFNKNRLLFLYEKGVIEGRFNVVGVNREPLILHTQHPQRAGLDLDHLLFPQ